MSYETKVFGTVEMKSDESGEFSATFSTFAPVVDHDKDVTLASAIPNGIQVPIGGYNHSSVTSNVLPVGVGTVRTDHRHAWVDASFLDTAGGRAYHAALKQLGSLVEWSYTFKILEASTDYRDREPYPGASRVLKRLDVIEVAPVIRGAGIATRTDSMKDQFLEIDDGLRSFMEEMEGAELLADYRRSLLEQMRHRLLSSGELATLIGD